jgi:glycine cleavage system H protein
MNFPQHLKYSKEHTWLLIEGNTGTVGITEFAQSELGEIVYVDLPSIGKAFTQDEVFGSVEAVKTVSDLFMPVSCIVTTINPLLKDKPTLINDEPFANGWMIKINITNIAEIEKLLSADDYITITGS